MIATLWAKDNQTLDSALFEVEEGKVVSLFAVGLELERVREDASVPKDMQRICVSKVVREYNATTKKRCIEFPPRSFCACTFCFESTLVDWIDLVEEAVAGTEGCWQLTPCSNFRLIGVPGIYRLHLNDTTAIGKAQVYAEQYDISAIPSQISTLFFS